MGTLRQAKRRGAFAERKATAVARREELEKVRQEGLSKLREERRERRLAMIAALAQFAGVVTSTLADSNPKKPKVVK